MKFIVKYRALLVLALTIIIVGIFFTVSRKPEKKTPPAPAPVEPAPAPAASPPESTAPQEWKFQPGPLSMDKIKTRGCVADGILSDYSGDSDEEAAMISRSQCQYLHRALETWLDAPDFDKARDIMQKINRPDMIYGMFIAEALNEKASLYYPDENRDFDFSAMCKPDTQNHWGERTCIPSLQKKEYQKYVKYITRTAMDLGIQSFMFGQVFLQDDVHNSQLPAILRYMRKYAEKNNIQIAIGAQTNGIENETYLRRFDYIEGGVGMASDGTIEPGPCLSTRPGCWALLWNNAYSSRANNVLIDLDWSAIAGDDMSKFTLMSRPERSSTLQNLYNFFTSRNMGFLMPMFTPIYKYNGGCYGPKQRFYSADKIYDCADEKSINGILSGG